jgi:hypothetical protein
MAPGRPQASPQVLSPVLHHSLSLNQKTSNIFPVSLIVRRGDRAPPASHAYAPLAIARGPDAQLRALADGEVVWAGAHGAASPGKREHASHPRSGHHQPQFDTGRLPGAYPTSGAC